MLHTISIAQPSIGAVVLTFLLGAAVCAGCGALDDAGARASEDGPVTIATVWPWESRSTLLYGQGLQMAVDEVNGGGGILGRPLAVLREDDHESVNQGRRVAQRLAQTDSVVAVIGHMQSYVTLPAAAIYDMFGKVHLAPTATDPRLTQHGYRRLFRMTVTDRETGARMADMATVRGYRRVAIYYVRSDYGRGLANAFEERALESGVVVADRQSYDPNGAVDERTLSRILTSWRDLNLDALFVAAEPRQAAAMIRAARASGLNLPVLGGDALGTTGFLSLGGSAVEGTIVAAVFHPDAGRETVRRFSVAFRQRYGVAPDTLAALAYDAVHLLAHAMTRAGSVEPDRVAEALRETVDWAGVIGPVSFADDGELVRPSTGAVVVRNGRFEWLQEIGIESDQ